MITEKIVEILGWSINFSCRLHTLPYVWNVEDSTVGHLPKSRYNVQLLPWLLNISTMWLHVGFLAVRILKRPAAQSAFDLLLHLSNLVFFILVSTVTLNVFLRKEEFLVFINNTIRFMLRIQETYLVEDLGGFNRRRWERMMTYMKKISNIFPFMLLILFFQNPMHPFYLSSIIPAWLPTSCFILLLIPITGFYYWMYLCLWSILSFHWFLVLICLISFDFTCEQIRHGKVKALTLENLRAPKVAAHTYVCLQVLLIQMNNCFEAVIFFLKLIVVVNCILNCYVLRKISGAMRKTVIIFQTLTMLILFLICLNILAMLHHNSKEVMRSWRVKSHHNKSQGQSQSQSPSPCPSQAQSQDQDQGQTESQGQSQLQGLEDETCRIKKFWKARQPLKIHVSTFYYIQYSIVLRIVGIILMATGKLLMIN